MSYVEFPAMRARIPPEFLTQALDDDGDGEIDAWEAVAADACSEIDGVLGARYTVPFPAPYPALVVRAARVFAAELCYLRRGVMEHPYAKLAEQLREELAEVAAGERPLGPENERAQPSGSVIAEPARTYSSRRTPGR